MRRVRGTLFPGAYCGSRAPLLGSVSAPVPQPVVTAPPMVTAPQYVQPQAVVPQCVPCQPQCDYICPTQVCDPCGSECGCTSYGGDCGCTSCGGDCGCSSYAGYAGDTGYSGDCGCDAPFGINVAPGEYFGGVETSDSGWGTTQEPTDASQDPGP